MEKARTRIAPSPTGQDLHIGNAYTALINYIVAAKSGGRFIIRIEDTDRARLVEGSEQKILASLKWLGIPYQEGPDVGGPFAPYRQSERLDIYKSHVLGLLGSGHAYYCFCTTERLSEMRATQEREHKPPMYDGLCKKIPFEESKERVAKGEAHVVRMNVPDEGQTRFVDMIRGEIFFENALIDDQVILKSDGYPTYHFGVVVDDHLMEITHIIRGEEWISSTPKHVLLYSFFGWQIPHIAHVSLLRNPDKSKLSKRKNPVWVSDYKQRGFLPEAIRNYFGLLAWSMPDGRDIFTTDEMMQQFDFSQVKTTAPIFDAEKLRWLCGEYIRVKTDKVLASLIVGYLKEYNPDFVKKYKLTAKNTLLLRIIPLVRERMKTLAEFLTLSSFFFVPPQEYERPPSKEALASLSDALTVSEWSHDHMESAIRAIATEKNLKAKDLFMELRIAVTGKSVGPPLLESLEILGKDETLSRLASK